jgi:integrase
MLLKAAQDDNDPAVYLFVAFGLNAAMRHSEIVRTRFEHIDFARQRIHLPTAKAGERDQPITAALALILERARAIALDREGWIFPAKGSAKTEDARRSHRPSMEYGFKRAVVGAGLDPSKVTPHIMRHTAITRLIQAGIDLPTVQKVSGHKTLAMVMRYTHVQTQHVDNAMLTLDAA